MRILGELFQRPVPPGGRRSLVLLVIVTSRARFNTTTIRQTKSDVANKEPLLFAQREVDGQRQVRKKINKTLENRNAALYEERITTAPSTRQVRIPVLQCLVFATVL